VKEKTSFPPNKFKMASCCVSLNLSIRKRSKTNTSDPAVVWGKERELTTRPEILANGTAINLEHFQSFQISWFRSDAFCINEILIQHLFAMFTFRENKSGELNQASKMLCSPPGAVKITSYKESLTNSACWTLFFQL